MFEGCLQAMAFYLAAMGFTVDTGRLALRAGARARPTRCAAAARSRRTASSLTTRCSSPRSRTGRSRPLYADVLCTVDGVKAFHAEARRPAARAGLAADAWRELGPHAEQTTGEAVPPSTLGGLVDHGDSGDGRRRRRLPLRLRVAAGLRLGPSQRGVRRRCTRVFDGTSAGRAAARTAVPLHDPRRRGRRAAGRHAGRQLPVDVEYDVPDERLVLRAERAPDACRSRVLMEVALQPCGWLASLRRQCARPPTRTCSSATSTAPGRCIGEITPGTRTLRTRATLTQVSQIGDMIIESSTVECFADDEPVFEMTTVFGFFPPDGVRQPGRPAAVGRREARPCSSR